MSQEQTDTITCSKCKAANPTAYHFCRDCGTPLRPPKMQTSTPPPAPLASHPQPSPPTSQRQVPREEYGESSTPAYATQSSDRNAEPPKTLVCPRCGNTNAYEAGNCLKCGLALAPIREAMAKASGPLEGEATAPGPEAMEPPSAPPPVIRSESSVVPPQPAGTIRKEGTDDLGYLYGGRLTLIRGMGKRVAQVRKLFFQQSEARGIPGASYSPAQLEVENQTRDYQFAERDLGSSAKANIGVRIAEIGTDLYVEWRHYVLPPIEFDAGIFLVVGVIAFLFACPLFGIMSKSLDAGVAIGLIVAILLGAWLAGRSRAIVLKGFQGQDSDAFQLAIRAAIDEAIDLAGIAKELRTETEYRSQLPQRKRLI